MVSARLKPRRRYWTPDNLKYHARQIDDGSRAGPIWLDECGVVKAPRVLRRLRHALIRRAVNAGMGRMTVHSAVIEAFVADHLRLEDELADSQASAKHWRDRAMRAEKLLNSEG